MVLAEWRRMNHHRWPVGAPGRGLASVGLLVTLCTGATAQSQRTMTMVDLIDVPVLTDPQPSPDGREILYVLGEADWDANRTVTHIWRVAEDGSSTVRMTNGEEGEVSPRWSPDGATIAFLAKRGDDEVMQVYLLPNQGGEARPLTEHPTAVSEIAWAPDGTAIYYLADDARTEEEDARDEAHDDVFRFEEDAEHRHLWRHDVVDGTAERVTDGEFSVLDYAVSRDGARIAVHRAPSPVLEWRDLSEVWVMNADGRESLRVTDNEAPERGATISPDGTRVLFLARTNERFQKYYNGNIFLTAPGTSDPRLVAETRDYDVTQAGWSADGHAIFFVANLGVHSQLFRLDLTDRTVDQLTEGRHAIRAWTFEARADQHALTISEPESPGEIWRLSPTTDGPQRVTHLYDDLSRDFALPRQERVEWRGIDGVSVEGLLYYPVDYVVGQRYPLVVQTHGGPQASDKFGWVSPSSYVPLLTGLGYAVLKPNYRGSTGYGDAFLRDMVGGYFRNAHTDVMAGVDHLIDRGVVDGDRMAKMGWSGGGHMTNKIITFTDRFKAASSGAGAANWVSMYAQSDTRSQRTPWFGGTPWQVDAPIDLYWEHSPLKYVANVTTPTIFLVGAEDERVPMPQSVEMHRALKSLGVPTHLYVAPREGHGWRELRHRLFKANAEVAWFERHVRERDYVWEQAPGGGTTGNETP